jgi:hypothetical protein
VVAIAPLPAFEAAPAAGSSGGDGLVPATAVGSVPVIPAAEAPPSPAAATLPPVPAAVVTGNTGAAGAPTDISFGVGVPHAQSISAANPTIANSLRAFHMRDHLRPTNRA